MEALAGRHQNLLPEHLLKALIDDPEGLAGHLVRDAGGDPELLKTAAGERLERLPKTAGNGPHPIFMSPELATVFAARQRGGARRRRPFCDRRAAAGEPRGARPLASA